MRGRRATVVTVLALVGLVLQVPAAGADVAAGPDHPPSSTGSAQTWTVQWVPGGLRVTLRLAAPLPVRDAMPWLSVDGLPLGVARESADHRSLALVTRDPRVLAARTVSVQWSPTGLATAAPRQSSSGARTLRPPGRVTAVDPGQPGRYRVDRSEYDLGDEAINLPGLGHRAELRARVYAPRAAPGRRPLVVFLHGRHSFCFGGADNWTWPCLGGGRPVPSYRGYDAPATVLASHGYQVVSISANAVNAFDFGADDGGALARAQLVLAHLDLWRRWSTVGSGPFGRRFVGRVDLHNVGLMGHSRGGEGMVRAALLNAERRTPYGIRAVLPLAPTDFSRPTLPGVALSVLLPYCDGDVVDLQGQHFFDDTRYAVTGDQAPRSAVLVMGANHNFFNTEWTPGQATAPAWDDWWGSAGQECGSQHPSRLSPTEQQGVGRAYVAGFFRLMLGRETALAPLFDGSGARAASAGRAVVRVSAHAPAGARRDIARLDRPLPAGAVTSAAAQLCAGVEAWWAPPPPPTALPRCLASASPVQAPHWTPAWLAPTSPTTTVTRLSWTSLAGRVRLTLPKEQRDVRRFAALTFRAAVDPASAGRPDLTVRLLDGRGRAAAVPVSAVSDALARLPGTYWPLPKTILRTIRVPLASLHGVDLRDVRTVELRTDRASSGAVFLADLAFVRPSLGRLTELPRLPQLSVLDVRTTEGDGGPRSADLTVTLSHRSRRSVTVYVETLGGWYPYSRIGSVSRRLVFLPGQTHATVSVPVTPNTRDDGDVFFWLVLSVPHEAVLERSLGYGVVLDDDPAGSAALSR